MSRKIYDIIEKNVYYIAIYENNILEQEDFIICLRKNKKRWRLNKEIYLTFVFDTFLKLARVHRTIICKWIEITVCPINRNYGSIKSIHTFIEKIFRFNGTMYK